jgi:hypothetical protein
LLTSLPFATALGRRTLDMSTIRPEFLYPDLSDHSVAAEVRVREEPEEDEVEDEDDGKEDDQEDDNGAGYSE